MNEQFTATANVDSKSSWNAVRKHVMHDPNVEHSNKDIDKDKTKYNIQITNLAKYDKALNDQYGDFVKEYDANQKRPERRYGTVKNYLKKQKGNPDERFIMTFGDEDSTDQLLADLHNQLDPDDLNAKGVDERYYKALNQGFKKFCQGFNRRNSNLTMTEAVTNLDEKGAPHVHAQLVPKGHTPKGKPSTKMTNALREQYGVTMQGEKGRSKAMTDWREQEDTALMRNMSKAFQAEFPELHLKSFKLARTGQKESVDMDEVKEKGKALDELKQQTEDAQKHLTELRQQLANEKADFDEYKQRNDETVADSAELSHENFDLSQKNEKLKAENESLKFDNQSMENLVFAGLRNYYPRGVNYKNRDRMENLRSVAKGDLLMEGKSGMELFKYKWQQEQEQKEQQQQTQQKQTKKKDYGLEM